MEDIFCKIINGEIPSEKIIEDENFIVIKDINPQAPVHLLIIPKKHIGGLNEIKNEDASLLGEIFVVARQAAEKIGIKDSGYRVIINEGEDGGKLVPHLHAHLLGGKKLGPKIVI